MADLTVRRVVLDIDSSGGGVGGLFDLVENIRAMKTAGEKPLWAVANESALSSAYAIPSAADQIYVTRTGEVGGANYPPAEVWAMTPRQIATALFFVRKRRQREMAQRLALGTLAAGGEPRSTAA